MGVHKCARQAFHTAFPSRARKVSIAHHHDLGGDPWRAAQLFHAYCLELKLMGAIFSSVDVLKRARGCVMRVEAAAGAEDVDAVQTLELQISLDILRTYPDPELSMAINARIDELLTQPAADKAPPLDALLVVLTPQPRRGRTPHTHARAHA